MQYQVFVQNLPDGLFSAFILGLPDIVAKGASVDEALNKAKFLLRERLSAGKLFTIEVEEQATASAVNPWLETHGSLRDDPTFDDWVEEIAKQRQEIEAQESLP